jgi:putative heme-binding domain-containing protein
VLALTGDPGRGKIGSARCVMCHQIDGNGPAYGPDLRGWAASQGREAFVQAVLTPSATIAHGFDGTAVRLTDGREVHGLVISGGDPLVVQSMGGLTQFIPGALIARKETQPLKRSLMLSAPQLGLTAQDVADLGAFFAGYR